MVVGAVWTVGVGLGGSVVELLAGVAGVPGSIPGPAICFQYMYMFIPPFLLQYSKRFLIKNSLIIPPPSPLLFTHFQVKGPRIAENAQYLIYAETNSCIA